MSRYQKQLVKRLASAIKTGTPIRFDRGTIVSSTTGQAVVSTSLGNVTAFTYGHSSVFPVGTVVDLLYHGHKATIIGSYDGDVPIGGLVANFIGPNAQVTATNATSTIGTLAVSLVKNHKYLLHGWVEWGVTAGAPSNGNVTVTDTASVLPIGTVAMSNASNPLTFQFYTGALSVLLLPGSVNVSDTLTIKLQGIGAGTTVAVNANSCELQVIRVA